MHRAVVKCRAVHPNYRDDLQSPSGSGCPSTRAGRSSSYRILEMLVGMASPSLNSFKILGLGLAGALQIRQHLSPDLLHKPVFNLVR